MGIFHFACFTLPALSFLVDQKTVQERFQRRPKYILALNVIRLFGSFESLRADRYLWNKHLIRQVTLTIKLAKMSLFLENGARKKWKYIPPTLDTYSTKELILVIIYVQRRIYLWADWAAAGGPELKGAPWWKPQTAKVTTNFIYSRSGTHTLIKVSTDVFWYCLTIVNFHLKPCQNMFSWIFFLI